MRFFWLLALSLSCAYHGNPPVPELKDGEKFLQLDSGKIHQSCLERYGSKILTVIKHSRKEGLACLRKLKGPGAEKNLKLLENLFASNQMTYGCQDHEFDWEGRAARASISQNANIDHLDLKHPFIAINPKYILTGANVAGEQINPSYLKEVFFHEYFHNVGYAHGYSEEYAYACEECCFPGRYTDRKSACRVCSSTYQGIEDEKYLKDFWKWSSSSTYKKAIKQQLILRMALFKKPSAAAHLEVLFKSTPKEDMVFYFTAVELEKSGKGSSFTKPFLQVPLLKSMESVIPVAQEAAQAQRHLIFESNLKAAMDIYRKLDIHFLKRTLRLPASENPVEIRFATMIWDSILYDMELILAQLMYKDQKNYEEMSEIYRQILEAKPRS